MYVDSQELFSDSQAVTTTAISTNVLDLNPDGYGLAGGVQDIGNGRQDIFLVVMTTVTVTGTTPTLNLTLESSAAVGLTSPTVHYSTGTLAAAAFQTAGTVFVQGLPLPNGDYLRYLGLRYTTSTFTAGAFTAFLTTDVQRYKYYASGFTVA